MGVQHPVDDQTFAQTQLEQSTAIEVSDADVTRLLRSCHEALQSLQLQELYSAYTSHVHRTAIVIHSPDPGTRWLGPGLGLGLGLVAIPNPS